MPQSGKLTVQSIDGYLVQVKTCIVKDEDPALPCDEDFIDSGTGEPAIGTDATGKVKFELSAEQLQKLKQKGYVKFKTVAPKGSKDVLFGDLETETSQDIVLVGTKFFDPEKFDEQVAPDNTDTFVLTPFTTMTEMLLKNEKQVTEEKYNATMKQLAESMGVDPATITTDFNEAADIADEKSKIALIAGEILTKMNFMPKTDDDLITVSNMNAELLSAKLKTEAKPLVGTLAEQLKELQSTDGIKDLLLAYNTKAEKSYVSLSTGIADDWRCAVNKLNEVVCWGNNAWNNLGNQEFTDKVNRNGSYETGHNGELLYLKNNYTPGTESENFEPIHVLVKNPYKTSDTDPEYVNLSGVTKVATGNSHGCAITLYGEVYCWGSNASGQLGLGSDNYNTSNSSLGYARKVVTGAQGAQSGHLSNVVDLSLGVDHSCALTSDGDIYCWGDNTAMELGAEFKGLSKSPIFEARDCNGLINDKIKIVADPVKVPAGDVKFSNISKAGSWAHCALSTKDTTDEDGHNLWCWGNDVGGIVTGNNKKHQEALSHQDWYFSETYGECTGFNDDVLHDSKYWYYTNNGLNKWPMFGQPVTNVKSIPSTAANTWEVCDKNTLNSETPSCYPVYGCTEDTYRETENSVVGYLSSWQVCRNIGIQIKNVTAMDINGNSSEPDFNIHFTTDDKSDTLFKAVTKQAPNNDEATSYITQTELLDLFEGNENIKEIMASSKHNVFVLSDRNKLYGVGSDLYGKVNNANGEKFAIPYDELNGPLVQNVSVNQRSVCTLVSNVVSEVVPAASMWCWGSQAFGQLGVIFSNTEYSYGWLFIPLYIYQERYNMLFGVDGSDTISTPKKIVDPNEQQQPD